MSGISENPDGSINIDITDEEWDEFEKEQEELEKQFYATFNKAQEIVKNGGGVEDIYREMLGEGLTDRD